ncbi:YfhO family protein [Chloroflexota bacterium]
MGQIILPIDNIYKVEPWKSEIQGIYNDPLWNPRMTDSIWQMYPTASLVNGAPSNGGFFWDPFVMSGMPAMARGRMFLNPQFVLLSAILPLPAAVNMMAVLHLFLASLFMFILLRQIGAKQFGGLIGAFAFAYNSYLISRLSLTYNYSTMVWLPLIFLGFELALKKQNWLWSLVGAIALTFQIFAGFILWPFYGSITLIVYSIYRSLLVWNREKDYSQALRPIMYAGLLLGIGTLLASPQLFPTIQLFFQSLRAQPLTSDTYIKIIPHFIRFIVPNIYGNDIWGDYYRGQFNYPETTLFFGILPLIFAFLSIFSRHRKIAWGYFGIGAMALFAVYNFFPFRQIISLVYPVFNNVFPGRIFYIIAFTWSVSAGLGADCLITNDNPNRRRVQFRAIWINIIFIGILLVYWGFSSIVLNQTQIFLSAILLILTLFLFLGWIKTYINLLVFQGIAITFLVVDIFFAQVNFNSFFDQEYLFPETQSIQELSEILIQENEPARIHNIDSILFGMTPELYRFPATTGYSSYVLKRYRKYLDLSNMLFPDLNHVIFTDCCDKYINALNTKYVFTHATKELTSTNPFYLIKNLSQATIDAISDDYISGLTWKIEGQEEKILYQHPPSRITFPLAIDKAATIYTSLFINSDVWDKHGDGVLFEIFLKPVNSIKEKRLFSRYIDPKNNHSERTPIPVEIDLSPYIGTEVHLSFITSPGPDDDMSYDWAGWINPRINNFGPLSVLIQDGPNRIYENTAALPRAWIVHRITHVHPDDLESVQIQLENPKFDFRYEAVVESDSFNNKYEILAPKKSYKDEIVEILDYKPEKVTIEAELIEPGLLILSDVNYPGWKVYVDGIEQEIFYTNIIMRGVFLEKGKHIVEFVYVPVMFYAGVVLSISTAIGLVIVFIWIRKMKIKQPPQVVS